MNKLLILIAAFLLIIQFSNAQTSAGTQTLGVNLGFSFSKTNEMPNTQNAATGSPFIEKYTTLSFGPSYSYFIANDLDLGASLGIASDLETNSDNNFGYPLKYTNNDFGGTIYIRKYFLYKSKFGIRTGPYISYDKSSYNYIYPSAQNSPGYNNHSNNLSAGIKLDLVYYASKKIGFSATLANLAYNHSSSNGGYYQLNQNGNGISLYTGTSALQISMFYVFGGKG